MKPWIRKLHKWVGVIIVVQFAIWTGSGLIMSLLDHDAVEGRVHRAHAREMPFWPAGVLAPQRVLADAGRSVQTLETMWLADRPVYRLANKAEAWLVDARVGQSLIVDAAVAMTIATRDYVGSGRPSTPEFLPKANTEIRGYEGPAWRVAFSDGDDTTIYLSARDGHIVERRNATWRLFDTVMMLHFMDYTGQQNFNNPLVILAASGGLWMALSGMWLLIASFRLSEFLPVRWRRKRNLLIFAPDGTKLRTVESHEGDSVFLALGRSGLHLPSNCGGGQSCGLCTVRLRGHAPPSTSSDREHITTGHLQLGYRLACNLPVHADIEVEVPGDAGLWIEQEAIVERVTAVTPFLREIRLLPLSPIAQEFQPGAYLQVHIPDYAFARQHIAHPEEHRDDWGALDLPATLVSKEPIRRSYSLSLPMEKADGPLTLLARFSVGGSSSKRQFVGKGSAYLYSLKPGDPVRFSGPFGDFALHPGDREKVFIAGGAGMAPLRAMIHSRLDQGGQERIHFWYGARHRREAPYIDEMAELALLHPNFTWHLVLSEMAEQGAGLIQGLVHEATHEGLLRDHPNLQACEFYLCGPPGMLSATIKLLRSLGISEERIAFDDFKI